MSASPSLVPDLPHSIEAEEGLLSCALVDGPEVIAKCIKARVGPDSFYVPAHAVIYKTMLGLYDCQAAIDLPVLAEELKKSKQLELVGGYAILTRVSNTISTTIQAGYFIERVKVLHGQRKLVEACQRVLNIAS